MPFINCDKLIREVRHRPLLWDTWDVDYKDKFKRDVAWNEIATALVPSFPDKAENDRIRILRHLITKWRTIRDGYVRYLKRERANPQKLHKPYAFAESMSFLFEILKVYHANKRNNFAKCERQDFSGEQDAAQEEQSIMTNSEEDENTDIKYSVESADNCELETAEIVSHDESDTLQKLPDHSQLLVSSSIIDTKQQSKRKLVCNTEDGDAFVDINAVKRLNLAAETDEDLAFFYSLLPTVKSLDLDNKFKFRIQTMHLLNHIRQQSAKTIENN